MQLLDQRNNTIAALDAVDPLLRGKTEARETGRVQDAPSHIIDAIVSHLSSTVAAMVELETITGMRPGEVCMMRECDIDASGSTWRYRPQTHKNEHRGLDRLVPLGPRAREIVQKFLKPTPQRYLFSPADSAAERREVRRTQRKTPLNEGNSAGTNVERDPKIAPGERFDPKSYRRAVVRACAAAFPPPPLLAKREDEPRSEWMKRLTIDQRRELAAWRKRHRFTPNQLRHSAATRWRGEFGDEATLAMLGDRTSRLVDVYAQKNHGLAARLAEQAG